MLRNETVAGRKVAFTFSHLLGVAPAITRPNQPVPSCALQHISFSVLTRGLLCSLQPLLCVHVAANTFDDWPDRQRCRSECACSVALLVCGLECGAHHHPASHMIYDSHYALQLPHPSQASLALPHPSKLLSNCLTQATFSRTASPKLSHRFGLAARVRCCALGPW